MPIQLASSVLTAEALSNATQSKQHYWRDLAERTSSQKTIAADPDEKNRLWLIETFATGTELYLEAYCQLRRGDYFEGWCTLEQAELTFARQQDNPIIPELVTCVERRAELIALWQSTFPYRHFVSPGMMLKRWECSICGKHSTPVDPCGHILKRVYAGECCFRRILEFDPREFSIVTDPVQKYSVVQLDHDYSVVQYVLDHLTGPFHQWSGEWTYKRHPHNMFADLSQDQPCPCESKLRYSECCMLTDGVRLPHFQMKVQSDHHCGQFKDRIVLHSKNEASLEEDDNTFRAIVLKYD